MKLLNLKKVHDGHFLKKYEIEYLNKKGKEKTYEIVSRSELTDFSQLGQNPSGVSIFATCGNQMLLLKEFRIGAGKEIYNLCAGNIDPGETIEECISRELFEETGLRVKQIYKILPPSFAAVGLSDITNYVAFVEAEGELSDHTSDNEEIHPSFYNKSEIETLVNSGAPFSSRAQILSYLYSQGFHPCTLK